jgi:hypothetical protein
MCAAPVARTRRVAHWCRCVGALECARSVVADAAGVADVEGGLTRLDTVQYSTGNNRCDGVIND